MKKRELKAKLAELAARVVELENQVIMLQHMLEWEQQRNADLKRPLTPFVKPGAPGYMPVYVDWTHRESDSTSLPYGDGWYSAS